MNAIIRTKNGFYCSTVFGYSNDGKNSAAIVLDENNSRLIAVKFYTYSNGMRRDVLVVEGDIDGWIKNNKWQGFDFIVGDKVILRRIKKGVDIPAAITEKCKSLQTSETFGDWINIDSQNAVKKLMNISLGFHDARIKRIRHDGKDIYVEIYGWSCKITIHFVNVSDYNEGADISWDNNCIIEAKIDFDNNNIKWAVDCFAYADTDDMACYFIAEHARYKIELRN